MHIKVSQKELKLCDSPNAYNCKNYCLGLGTELKPRGHELSDKVLTEPLRSPVPIPSTEKQITVNFSHFSQSSALVLRLHACP